jgi:hypothetical protein
MRDLRPSVAFSPVFPMHCEAGERSSGGVV